MYWCLSARKRLQIENDTARAALMLFSSVMADRLVSRRLVAHAPANAPNAAAAIVPTNLDSKIDFAVPHKDWKSNIVFSGGGRSWRVMAANLTGPARAARGGRRLLPIRFPSAKAGSGSR